VNPRTINQWTLAIVAGGTILGVVAYLANQPGVAAVSWAAITAVALLPLTASIVSALRHSKLGVDAIALLAMAGALFLGQYLAGAIIALMLAGGQALEHFADSRARRELSSLLQRAPRVAHRCDGETVTSIDVEEVALGDLLLIKPGEVVPVDGVVVGKPAVLDVVPACHFGTCRVRVDHFRPADARIGCTGRRYTVSINTGGARCHCFRYLSCRSSRDHHEGWSRTRDSCTLRRAGTG
jgi:hypothetical protein